MYWKDVGGILLNYLLNDEAKKIMEEFHQDNYGGHLYRNDITNKISMDGFY